MTDKAREKCGKRVHVMFYPDADVTCTRLAGHEGEHSAPTHAAPEEIDTTAVPEGTAGAVVTSTTELPAVTSLGGAAEDKEVKE